MSNHQTICISGAGLVGALWSVFLAQKGHQLKVFERRPDLRKAGNIGGRSINLALSDRGWRALKSVGMEKLVREVSIPMYGRMIHDTDGKTRFLSYGKKDQAIYSVSRSGLNALLLDEAEKYPNVEIYFRHQTENINLEEKKLEVFDEKSKKNISIDYATLFGTDGAFSKVRERLMKTDRFNYSQDYIEHGYKELSIPPGETNKWQLDKNCLHIWPRKSFMLIALPNLDGSFTVTLFLAFEGKENAFEQLTTKESVITFFQREFPDALTLMPDLTEDFFNNPTGSLVTVRCEPWHYDGNVCLMGDAAHAVVPFYGQGMNAGFEDCTVLSEIMNKTKNHEEAIRKYSQLRKPDGDAIADLALDNFIEMRDKVADEHFLLKKSLERKISEIYPDTWIPLYSMVTFEPMPYSEALKRGQKQDAILEKILENEDAQALMNDNSDLKKTIEAYL